MPGFVHQIDDELQFVKAFEVGHLGGIARFDQRFESRLNKRRGSAAKDGLFAEEIGFCFFFEGGLDDATASSANALGPGQGDLFRVLAGILVDGDQRGHALAFGELAAHDVAGPLRRHHDDIDVLRGHDGLEMNAEAVREEERFALGQIRRDVLLVGGGLLRVGEPDQDHVGTPHGLGGIIHRKSILLGDLAALAAGIQANDDFAPAVLEIQGMGVPCEPKPRTARVLPLRTERSASLSV